MYIKPSSHGGYKYKLVVLRVITLFQDVSPKLYDNLMHYTVVIWCSTLLNVSYMSCELEYFVYCFKLKGLASFNIGRFISFFSQWGFFKIKIIHATFWKVFVKQHMFVIKSRQVKTEKD